MPMQDSYTLDAFLSANQQYQASKGMTNDNTSKTSVMDICQITLNLYGLLSWKCRHECHRDCLFLLRNWHGENAEWIKRQRHLDTNVQQNSLNILHCVLMFSSKSCTVLTTSLRRYTTFTSAEEVTISSVLVR